MLLETYADSFASNALEMIVEGFEPPPYRCKAPPDTPAAAAAPPPAAAAPPPAALTTSFLPSSSRPLSFSTAAAAASASANLTSADPFDLPLIGSSKNCGGPQYSLTKGLADGFNEFLKHLDVSLRRDPANFRPRVNKKNSSKDREQKAEGKYFIFDAEEDAVADADGGDGRVDGGVELLLSDDGLHDHRRRRQRRPPRSPRYGGSDRASPCAAPRRRIASRRDTTISIFAESFQ